MDYGAGNPTYPSTALNITANPSTAALLAELDSTIVNGFLGQQGKYAQLTWVVGGSTTATFALEQCLSTGLDMSTAGRTQVVVFTAANQSAQYLTRHVVELGDRFRCRVLSTLTGNVAAKIVLEPLI